jgi:hypothetical protein
MPHNTKDVVEAEAVDMTIEDLETIQTTMSDFDKIPDLDLKNTGILLPTILQEIKALQANLYAMDVVDLIAWVIVQPQLQLTRLESGMNETSVMPLKVAQALQTQFLQGPTDLPMSTWSVGIEQFHHHCISSHLMRK